MLIGLINQVNIIHKLFPIKMHRKVTTVKVTIVKVTIVKVTIVIQASRIKYYMKKRLQ